MEPVCEVSAVPDEKLVISRDGLHRVEVDAHAVLASGQVLLLLRVSWIHIAHPVALLLIQAIHEVMEISFRVNLRTSRRSTMLLAILRRALALGTTRQTDKWETLQLQSLL